MAIEIGVILPTSTPDPRQPILGDVRAAARLAEELNLGSVWSTDHLIASAPLLDSTVVLATAAAVTGRDRRRTLPPRNPASPCAGLPVPTPRWACSPI